jgi:hypothetical protein
MLGMWCAGGRADPPRHGLTKPEIDRMASAFEHRDLEMASDG